MKTYRFTMSTHYVGSEYEEDFEFEDDVSDESLREFYTEWIWNNLDGGYAEVDQ